MNDSINVLISREISQSTVDLIAHKYDLAQRNWWMSIAIIMAVVLFLISIMLIVHDRMMRHRNKAMSAVRISAATMKVSLTR